MEYALDGYGYSAARLLRSMLAQRRSEGGESLHSRAEVLLQLLEHGSGLHSEHTVKAVSRILLGDQLPAFEPPPELLATLLAWASRASERPGAACRFRHKGRLRCFPSGTATVHARLLD